MAHNPVFSIESEPLKFIHVNIYYNCSPRKVSKTKIQLLGQAVKIRLIGKNVGNLELADYSMSVIISSSFPPWTKTIENTRRLTARYNAYGDQINYNNRRKLLRPEQKSAVLIRTLVKRILNLENLFL